jgi:hypothetical protein
METKISKSFWANGNFAILIHSYSHSPQGFNSIVNCLAENFSFEKKEPDIIGPMVIPEILDYWLELNINGNLVIVAMDEYTCSIASPNEKIRDEIFDFLSLRN